MKINIAYPAQGTQKCIEIDDEKKLRAFYDKRISQEVSGEDLGDEFAGFVFRISGGNDKQGFAMKQGVLTNGRVRILMAKGASSYRPRRTGERKRKSVRGCIVGPDLSVLNLVVVKKGDNAVEGLTDVSVPKRLGFKRASKIRRLFNVEADEVKKSVIQFCRKVEKKGKTIAKRPRIQRLVTPTVLYRKHKRAADKIKSLDASKKAAAEYSQMIAQRAASEREARRSELSKRRSSRKASAKATA